MGGQRTVGGSTRWDSTQWGQHTVGAAHSGCAAKVRGGTLARFSPSTEQVSQACSLRARPGLPLLH